MGQPVGQDSAGTSHRGLSLTPLRGTRPAVGDERLGRLLCPPYDVIDDQLREALLAGDAENAVGVVLPDPTPEGYEAAAAGLRARLENGVYAVDPQPALYVYEMAGADGHRTRGLLGAVELRDPVDGVILPHENTMAGPVADRLAVMTATDADLEPIYLVYDGGGTASDIVRDVDTQPAVATATTPDGITHRLWRLTDPQVHDAVAHDLADRRALIADGHHRYATYRERQRLRRETDGAGPWDRGLALLVDSTAHGPQVHAIHRVITGLPLADAVRRLDGRAHADDTGTTPEDALALAEEQTGFAAVLTDGARTVLVTDPDGALAQATVEARRASAALAQLDVSLVHQGLVEQTWGLPDDVDTVGYAHSVAEAVGTARARDGFALLLRPTPVAAVAAVAAAGERMPRKSTLFTPKPASGLVIRRLADQV